MLKRLSGSKSPEIEADSQAWTSAAVKQETVSSGNDSHVTNGMCTKSTSYRTSLKSIKTDFSSMFSARECTTENLVEVDRVSSVRRLPPSYPLPLILFVAFLSILAGFVVTLVHDAIKYSGCPLGLNGCNSFTGKDYGFFLVRWVRRVSNDSIPEDFVYITAACLGSTVLAIIYSCLPPSVKVQITGGGTIQSLQAVSAGERIRFRCALLRVICTSIFLGTSGTLGMEGPAIQVCTSLTTNIGYVIGMRATATQSLLASLGFAGGFAASFNSPLAGILFAMEELQHISNRVSRHIICVMIMASVISTATARACAGNNQLLEKDWSEEIFASVSGGSLDKVFGKRMWMLIAIPIGFVASIVGCAMSRMLHVYQGWIDKMKRKSDGATFVSQIVLAACIGSVVFRLTELRGVWGIGYESMQRASVEDLSAGKYFIFAAGKLLATVVSLSVRGPGDILEPVLIGGAFFGGGCGRLLQLVPAFIDDNLADEVVQPCLVFGMVGLFASCFRFPLTPVVIVLEIMGVETYALLLPAALSGFTAILVSNRLFRPILEDVMWHDGISLEAAVEDDDYNSDPSEAEEEPPPDAEKHSEYSGISSRSGSEHSSKDRFKGMVALIEGAMLQGESRASSKSTVGSHKKRKGKAGIVSRDSSRTNTSESHISVGFSIGVPENEELHLHPTTGMPSGGPGQKFSGSQREVVPSSSADNASGKIIGASEKPGNATALQNDVGDVAGSHEVAC